jgi:hypothetical protein
MNPYYDVNIDNGVFLREFSPEVEESELIWHRDLRDREITVLEAEGWKLQFDNELPFELKVGDNWFIPSMQFHRLWRGSGTLSLKIREMD